MFHYIFNGCNNSEDSKTMTASNNIFVTYYPSTDAHEQKGKSSLLHYLLRAIKGTQTATIQL